MPITIEQRTQDRFLIVTVRGSFLGAADAKEFRAVISGALANKQRLILVNFNELAGGKEDGLLAVDDFGITALLASAFMAKYAGGALEIFGASAAVVAALKAGSAADLLSQAESETGALDDLTDLAPSSQPFDILQFVREEEREEEAGGSMSGLTSPEAQGS